MNTNLKFSDQKFDAELRELFKTQKRAKVSDNFTEKVMGQIERDRLIVTYKPVISARALIAIALFVGIMVVLALVQDGNSTQNFWSLSGLSAFSFFEVLNQWQQHFTIIWSQRLVPSGIFLPLLGLLIALSIHYIFLAILSNRSNKKSNQLYCL